MLARTWLIVVGLSLLGCSLTGLESDHGDVDRSRFAADESIGCDSRCSSEGADAARPLDPGTRRLIVQDRNAPIRPAERSAQISLGPSDAPISIFMYADIGCPHTKSVWPTMQQLVADNAPRLRVIVKHFTIKDRSDTAAAYLEAARQRSNDAALRLVDAMLANPPSGTQFLFGGDPLETIDADIRKVGLDRHELDFIIDDMPIPIWVRQDQDEARRLGFSGTPAFVIAGQRVSGTRSKEIYQSIIDGTP